MPGTYVHALTFYMMFILSANIICRLPVTIAIVEVFLLFNTILCAVL